MSSCGALSSSFLTGTAIAVLLAGSALADDNLSFVDQDGRSNTALIDQATLLGTLTSSTGNRAGRGNNPVLQDGRNNTLTISQSGLDNLIGTRRTLPGVRQVGTRNTIDAVQSGTGNRIDTIEQAGNRNTASVSMQGTQNGFRAIRANSFAFVGAPASGVTQTGRSNDVAIAFDGIRNRFGIEQTGNNNNIDNGAEGTVEITGDRNRFGVSQQGNRNTLAVASFVGNRNDVGIDQADGSTATLTLDGSDNAFAISQADGASTVTLTINGDANGGVYGFTPGGPTAALQAAAALSDFGLAPGTIRQAGRNNTISLAVHGEDGVAFAGTDNLFAILQMGNRNSVNGTQAGKENEVAIFQSGNRNSVTFTQTGVGNLLAVSQ